MNKLHPSTKRALTSLPAPKLPLKGRGFAREDFPFSLSNKLAAEIWYSLPALHKCEVAHRRAKGYFGFTNAISPEAAQKAAKAIQAIRSAESLKFQAKIEKHLEQKPLPTVQRDHSAVICVNLENLAKSDLSPVEQSECANLLNGALHPVHGRALELKNKSGLTWGQLQK